jgi:hypothetical protein
MAPLLWSSVVRAPEPALEIGSIGASSGTGYRSLFAGSDQLHKPKSLEQETLLPE